MTLQKMKHALGVIRNNSHSIFFSRRMQQQRKQQSRGMCQLPCVSKLWFPSYCPWSNGNKAQKIGRTQGWAWGWRAWWTLEVMREVFGSGDPCGDPLFGLALWNTLWPRRGMWSPQWCWRTKWASLEALVWPPPLVSPCIPSIDSVPSLMMLCVSQFLLLMALDLLQPDRGICKMIVSFKYIHAITRKRPRLIITIEKHHSQVIL